MTDEQKSQQHHPDCGDVGDVGDVGDLGTNAINHPVRIAQATSAADLDAVAGEQKAAAATDSEGCKHLELKRVAEEITPPIATSRPARYVCDQCGRMFTTTLYVIGVSYGLPAPEDPTAALAERLTAVGYGEDEARRMAASAIDQLAARKTGA